MRKPKGTAAVEAANLSEIEVIPPESDASLSPADTPTAPEVPTPETAARRRRKPTAVKKVYRRDNGKPAVIPPMADATPVAFDARRHLIKINGRDYLPVAARVVWFRMERPGWGIVTEAVEYNLRGIPETNRPPYAIFKASIFDDAGKLIATATKYEDAVGFADFGEKAECVPLDTQILTASGWKTYSELQEDEPVLSYDVKNDRSEWVPLQRVVTYKAAPLTRLFNGWGFDVLCTKEHTWATVSSTVVKGKTYEYRQLKNTSNLSKSGAIVTACPAPSGENFDVTPDLAAVMGWLITDGGFHRPSGGKCLRGIIYQSKPSQVAEIRALLERTGLTFTEKSKESGIQNLPAGRKSFCLESFRWHLTAESMRRLYLAFGITHERELETVLPSLTEEARAAMLAAMLRADGSDKGDFGKKRKPWVMPVYQCLCALTGVALSKYRYSSVGEVPIQKLKKTRHTHLSKVNREDAGTAPVWCPTTKYGTWYARFANGVTTITGNTGSIGRALALCGYGTQFAPEFEEGTRLADTPRQTPGIQATRPPRSNQGYASAPNRPPGSAPAGVGDRPTPVAVPESVDDRHCSIEGCSTVLTPSQYALSMGKHHASICVIHQKQGATPSPRASIPAEVPVIVPEAPVPSPDAPAGQIGQGSLIDSLEARKRAYEVFAQEAYRLGFNVTTGEHTFSFPKVGALLCEATACPTPAKWQEWFPACALVETARLRLPAMARAREAAKTPATVGAVVGANDTANDLDAYDPLSDPFND